MFLVSAGTFLLACWKAEPFPGNKKTIMPFDLPAIPARGFFMGILPTPGEKQELEEAYRQASQHAEFAPVWGRPTPFYKLAQDLSGNWGQLFVDKLIRGHGMFPLLHLSFIDAGMTLQAPPGMKKATLSDPTWRAAYKRAILEVVKVARPLYLSLGNEVNRWYEKYGSEANNPNGFQHYVSLYESIYDLVKRLSPRTQVFCVFAREVVSEHREANLDVLRMFNPKKMDLLVFTSYPYAVKGIKTPSDISLDYYSKAMRYMPGKPFGFSELGWAALGAFGGEEGQAEFMRLASGTLTRGQGLALHLFAWVWLHDLDEKDTVGLIRRDGTPKKAYGVWKNLSSSTAKRIGIDDR